MSFRRHLIAIACLVACCATANAFAQPTPSSGTPPPLPGAKKSNNPSQPPLDEARQGVVVILRAGKPAGLGFVLNGDGRVVTSLSVVGDGNHIDVRYADDSVVDVRVGHTDRVWDLALLVPQVGRWSTGLEASSADPLAQGSRIRTFARRDRSVRVATVVLKGRSEMLGGDGELLRDAIEITTQIPGSDLGAPLVDDRGRVLGVVGRACNAAKDKPDEPCRAVAYGSPIDALRQFLRSAPSNAIPPSPWLGIQGVAASTPNVRGVRVVGIHPSSPAATAQLQDNKDGKGSDLIVAVDGTPVRSPEQLAELVRSKAVGDDVQLIVLRAGKYHVLHVALTATPTGRGTAKPPE